MYRRVIREVGAAYADHHVAAEVHVGSHAGIHSVCRTSCITYGHTCGTKAHYCEKKIEIVLIVQRRLRHCPH